MPPHKNKRPKQPQLKVTDVKAHRHVTPLLTWPKNPKAHDLLALHDVWFPPPDTYSLNYQARLLGLRTNPDSTLVQTTTESTSDCSLPSLPPLGTWAQHWKEQRLVSESVPQDLVAVQHAVQLTQWSKLARLLPKSMSTMKDYQWKLLGDLAPQTNHRLGVCLYRSSDQKPVGMITWTFLWLGQQSLSLVVEYARIHDQVVLDITGAHETKGKVGGAEKSTNSKPSNPTKKTEEQDEPLNPPQHSQPTTKIEKKLSTKKDTTKAAKQDGRPPLDLKLATALMSCAWAHAQAAAAEYVLVYNNTKESESQMPTWISPWPNLQATPGGWLGRVSQSSPKLARLHCEALLQGKKEETSSTDTTEMPVTRLRVLAQLPTVQQAQGQARTRKPETNWSSAAAPLRQLTVSLSVTLKEASKIECRRGAKLVTPTDTVDNASMHIIKTFVPPTIKNQDSDGEDELVQEMKKQQKRLQQLEGALHPRLHSLWDKVVQERRDFEESGRHEKARQKRTLKAHTDMLARRLALDQAVAEQRELDMDAVCHVCGDGEVTPENQILFCENCNVAVHQFCYGVEKIPAGDYYCPACKFNLDKSAVPEIFCELCCKRGGAYIRTAMKNEDGREAEYGRWVHFVCAKWQGLNFVSDSDKELVVEDVTELKASYRRLGIVCSICKGARGAMNECRYPGCKVWLHVTCARAVGTCQVIHGENVHGPVETNPWTLMCPEHSKVIEIPENAMTAFQLQAMAKECPAEAPPTALPFVPIPFNTANGQERKILIANKDYENELLIELTTKKFFGVRCEVCDQNEDNGVSFTRCISCAVIFCGHCKLEVDGKETHYKCMKCVHLDELKRTEQEVIVPTCQACYKPNGWLRKGFAKSTKKAFKNTKSEEYKQSLFAQTHWCHSLCAFWHAPKLVLNFKKGEVDFTNVVSTDGHNFIMADTKCFLCGKEGGFKLDCDHKKCHTVAGDPSSTTCFHVTCARQAGLEVEARESPKGMKFFVKCYQHGSNEFNLRARLEDLIEKEKLRSGKNLQRVDAPMTFAHGSRLLNGAIRVLQSLGWAWRWAEWWVDYDSTWEPLLEPGEREEDMTKEQLKIVDTSRTERCSDARRCRLAAFGAALRNRAYDKDDGDFDRASLDRALRAILNTPRLVGPLDEAEIEFFAQWLGMAYRSKSTVLGFGDDKVPISEDFKHVDGSPKYELGDRSVPGTQPQRNGRLFESNIIEPDDFYRYPIPDIPNSKRKKSAPPPRVEMVEDKVKKRRGRPPKDATPKKSPGRKATTTPPESADSRRGRRQQLTVDIDWDTPPTRKRRRRSPSPIAQTSGSRAAQKKPSKVIYKHDGIDLLDISLTLSDFVAERRKQHGFVKEEWNEPKAAPPSKLTPGRQEGRIEAARDEAYLGGKR